MFYSFTSVSFDDAQNILRWTTPDTAAAALVFHAIDDGVTNLESIKEEIYNFLAPVTNAFGNRFDQHSITIAMRWMVVQEIAILEDGKLTLLRSREEFEKLLNSSYRGARFGAETIRGLISAISLVKTKAKQAIW